MNKEDLLKLREIFRVKFREHDFCIGEEQVEDVFRELLGEPKPESIQYTSSGRESKITAADVSEIMKEQFKNVSDIFERDDTFFRSLKK